MPNSEANFFLTLHLNLLNVLFTLIKINNKIFIFN